MSKMRSKYSPPQGLPTTGGSYTRQADGSLVKQEDPVETPADAPAGEPKAEAAPVSIAPATSKKTK